MSPLTESTRVVLSRIQQYPAVLGEPWGGGYFAGYISHTADGNPTHALIVAPRETGATGTGYTLTTNLQWKTSSTDTPNAYSVYDGVANTAAMVEAGINDHPAAKFCIDLNIGGFTDWYLPSGAELSIAYYNLKPSAAPNRLVSNSAVNIYAVPRRDANWTSSYPPISYVNLFTSGGEEFVAGDRHWASDLTVGGSANAQFFDDGRFSAHSVVLSYKVRAFRRIAL